MGYAKMDTKGPTLIATSLGLLFSGIVMVQSQKQTATTATEDTAVSPSAVAEATRSDDDWSRRTTTGGAVFVSSNDE